MAINSPQELLELLQQSRLLTPEQIDDVHDSMLLTHDVAQLLDMLVGRDILTAWQKTQLLAGRTGFFIGNYVLLDLLGRGGMGSVFLARHTTMNRRCAVKVVSKKVGKDPDSLDQFLTEARAIASLDHANIVQAYDVDKENDHFYIVMEYVEGQSLDEIVLHEGILDCESAVDCIRQAAQGLAHAHGRNMVHCDIKPSNLLVNEQGVVKILDMGMARLVGDSGVSNSDSKSNEKILGTVDYMAPEQAVSSPGFDFRADIYSLGCTLFTLLVGHPPFDEGTLTQRILKHQTQSPPDLRQFRSDVPDDLAAICLKMMAKEPNDRYQTADEVAGLLTNWKMPELPAEAPAEPPPLPGPEGFDESDFGSAEAAAGPALKAKASKKKSFWEDERILLPILGIIVAVVFGLLLFLVIAFSGGDHPPVQPNEVVTEAPVAPGEQEGTDSPGAEVPETGVRPPETPTVPPENIPPKPLNFGHEKESKPVEPPAPAPPTKTPPEPPLPVRINPLADLPVAVDLPRNVVAQTADIEQPLPLGNFLVSDDSDVAKSLRIRLIGGETALAEHTFRIAKAASSGLPKWTFYLVSKDGTEQKIARMWIEKDHNLMFRWLCKDSEISAGYLRACALEITDGNHTHRMPLTKVQQIDPLKIIPITDVITYDVTPPVLPAAEAIRLKLTGYNGPFRVTYDPSPILKANHQTNAILSGKNLPMLVLNFEYEVKGSTAQLKVKCWYEPPGNIRGIRRTPVSMRNLPRFGRFFQNLETQKNKLLYQNTNPARREELKKILKAQAQLTNLFSLFNELKSVTDPSKIPEDYEGLGVFHFQEYIETDQGKIELLETKPISETEP